MMESLVTFWGWIYFVGLASFFILALVIVPLGGRDLILLFKSLSRRRDDGETADGKRKRG